jgi:hypothetical protein
LIRKGLADGTGHAKVNHLGHGLVTLQAHQNIGGLDVTVNNALLVGVLHGLAYLQEQGETRLNGEPVMIAVLRNGSAPDMLHDKIRSALFCGAGVKHARDIGMIQEGQGLLLALEAGQDTF